ncbi:CBS domain-containing protein [Arthrobacter sp. LS16]|uniref:CBS domain-containing protein n=1 Tax=Arthrobacter sp. 'calajunan' TaxID=1690248 RepID=UPI003C711084
MSASANADSGERARIVVGAVASGVETSKAKVAEHAQGKPITIGADDTLKEAIRIMQRHQVRRLPVTDSHELLGMLSQSDTARHADEHRTGEMVSEISEP